MSGAAASRRTWPAQLAGAALAFQALFAMTSFGRWLRPEYGAIAALLLLVAAGGARWRALARHPLAWLVLAFVVYAVLQAAYVAQLAPDVPVAKHLSANAEPVRVGVFACAIGAWLADRPRYMPHLLGLMVVGFALAALACAPWRELGAVVAGSLRLRFRYAENIVGEYAAIGLLLLTLYAASTPLRGRAAKAAALGLAALLLLACLLYAQSRAAWLAAGLIPLVAVAHQRAVTARWRRPAAVAAAAAVFAVAAVLCVGYTLVARRFAGGEALAEALAHGGLATLPPSSASVRLQLAALGLHAWQAHPLLGSGLYGIGPMIAASGIRIADYVPPHLHNAYLQAAVGLGGIGAALLLAAFGVLVRELVLARRAGEVGAALYWALLGSLGIVLVVNAFDFLLWRFDYLRAPLEILLGCCFALSLRRRGAGPAAGA